MLELPGQYQICLDFEKYPIFRPETRYHYLADIYGVCNCISCEHNDLILIVSLETIFYQPRYFARLIPNKRRADCMVPNLGTTMEKGIKTLIIQKDILNGVKQTIKLTNANIKSSYNVIVAILWSQRFRVLELLRQCQICLVLKDTLYFCQKIDTTI